jgi:hypothetical protein
MKARARGTPGTRLPAAPCGNGNEPHEFQSPRKAGERRRSARGVRGLLRRTPGGRYVVPAAGGRPGRGFVGCGIRVKPRPPRPSKWRRRVLRRDPCGLDLRRARLASLAHATATAPRPASCDADQTPLAWGGITRNIVLVCPACQGPCRRSLRHPPEAGAQPVSVTLRGSPLSRLAPRDDGKWPRRAPSRDDGERPRRTHRGMTGRAPPHSVHPRASGDPALLMTLGPRLRGDERRRARILTHLRCRTNRSQRFSSVSPLARGRTEEESAARAPRDDGARRAAIPPPPRAGALRPPLPRAAAPAAA